MSALDVFVEYKFIKFLTTPFDKTDAYKLGLIDKDGKVLKKRSKLKTGKEKMAMTIFHTLAWNLKKLLDKFPPTKTKLGSFAAGLFLIKEQYGLTDDDLDKILTKMEIDVLDFINEDNQGFVL